MAIGMLRGANSRFKSLLDGLKAEGDLARQEGALTELCDMLCMATEETLQGFSMDAFLPPLIALVNCEVVCPLLHSVPASAPLRATGCASSRALKLLRATVRYNQTSGALASRLFRPRARKIDLRLRKNPGRAAGAGSLALSYHASQGHE